MFGFKMDQLFLKNGRRSKNRVLSLKVTLVFKQSVCFINMCFADLVDTTERYHEIRQIF